MLLPPKNCGLVKQREVAVITRFCGAEGGLTTSSYTFKLTFYEK